MINTKKKPGYNCVQFFQIVCHFDSCHIFPNFSIILVQTLYVHACINMQLYTWTWVMYIWLQDVQKMTLKQNASTLWCVKNNLTTKAFTFISAVFCKKCQHHLSWYFIYLSWKTCSNSCTFLCCVYGSRTDPNYGMGGKITDGWLTIFLKVCRYLVL